MTKPIINRDRRVHMAWTRLYAGGLVRTLRSQMSKASWAATKIPYRTRSGMLSNRKKAVTE